MFHSYLGTLLYYSFFFFFLSIIIRSSLFPRCSIFPCTRVLSCPRVSSYLSIASIPPFFPFVLPPCPLYSTVPACFIFLYLPSLFFDIPATGPTIFVPLVSVRPTWSSLHLPSSSLKISRSPYAYTYIFHTLHPFSTQSSSYLSRINLIRLAFD